MTDVTDAANSVANPPTQAHATRINEEFDQPETPAMNLQLELNYRQKKTTHLLTGIFGVISFFLFGMHTLRAIIIWLALLYLLFKNSTFVFVTAKTIKRDIISGKRFLWLNVYLAYIEWRQWSVARIFQEVARKDPQKPCILLDERVMTFQDIEDYTNKVGAYFKSRGLRRGDCVALFMETRPEYVCFWLGLSKIGVHTALINSHLRRDTLLHSFKVAQPKAIIVGTELIEALQQITREGTELASLPIYEYSDDAQRSNDDFKLMKAAKDLKMALKLQKSEDLSSDIAKCKLQDKLMYVYTSGTTGLPKAANITNQRYLFLTFGASYMLAFETNDIIYNPLPLYHTAGGIVGVGSALLTGCTVALRKKFSAANFWKDCIRYDCTIAQYIGELCRYLLSKPLKPEDQQHRLRMMYGNGMRPQIWSQFVTRFNIPHIGEVYGSTEGNSNLANVTNQVGAVGFVPVLISRIFPIQMIKCDEETGEPLRKANGCCIRCPTGETGLLIGKVNAKRASTAFSGYADKKASDNKLLRDVFHKGDSYFNTGDMVVRDIFGFFYFKDRTGDTFRWRGENVATMEVEAIITNVIGLQDCVVYGVEIPHVEGKAGMAAIVDPDREVDLQHLSIGIRGSLPNFAQPLFIRLMAEIPRTATFKMKKRELMLDGFDKRKIKDPIYYLNKDGIYRPLKDEQFYNLLNGTAGL